MKWEVLEGPTIPFPFDPAFPQMLDIFTEYANSAGFTTVKDMQPAYFGIGKTISRRFYRPDKAFPLLQIGPGIFAANESVEYEWTNFKKMTLDAAMIVTGKFPKLNGYPLKLDYVELRYIDTFDQSLIETDDFLTFVNEATTAKIEWPCVPEGNDARPSVSGRLRVECSTKKPKGGIFYVDVASAKKDDGTAALRIETKVRSAGGSLPQGASSKRLAVFLSEWLEEAHLLTSASFKEFVRPNIFGKFQ